MSKLLSVIIPVYNAEETLNRCIQSIVEQTYYNMEIILIDDGSTDRSRMLCEYWCSRDARIVLAPEKENEGLAEARNLGMRLSHGDYLAFVDSDDYLELFAYEKMIYTIEHDGSDMVLCNFWNYKESSGEKSRAYKLSDECRCSVLEDFAFERLPMSAWCKILRRELMLPKFGEAFWFPRGRRYEDTVVSFIQGIKANKVSIMSEPLYYYVQGLKTITARPIQKDIEDIIKNVIDVEQLLAGKLPVEVIACYECSSLTFALQLYYRCDKQNPEIQQKLLEKINCASQKIHFWTVFKSSKKLKILLCKMGIVDAIVSKKEQMNLGRNYGEE